MKTQTTDTLSYCFNMLSFIFQNPEAGKINSIYLFGSAVRGELSAKSDIDIFIDCKKSDEKQVERVVNSGMVRFSTSKEYQKWKLRHFTFPFSAQMGQLQEWDLKLSIASEGILLFNKENIINTGERKVIFIISYPKKKKEYIKIRRLLFGRDETFYKGTGLIQMRNGEKISSNVFLVPKEEQTKLREVLAKEKIDFSMKEMVSLTE